MTQCSKKEILLQLPSSLVEVDKIIPVIADFLANNGLQKLHFGVELVARELLNNSILHGNKLDKNKHVELRLSLGRRWICLLVTDQGEGFNWQKINHLPPDSSAESGRGMAIVRAYGQRILFGNGGRGVKVYFDQNISTDELARDNSGRG